MYNPLIHMNIFLEWIPYWPIPLWRKVEATDPIDIRMGRLGRQSIWRTQQLRKGWSD